MVTDVWGGQEDGGIFSPLPFPNGFPDVFRKAISQGQDLLHVIDIGRSFFNTMR